jgi:cation diffusion facilitator family transporter
MEVASIDVTGMDRTFLCRNELVMFDDNRSAARHALYRSASRAALIGIVMNLALGAVKLCCGLFGESFALLSDAVNSLGDVFASAVVLFAFRVAQQPADEEHPYGHTRAEAIAGSNVALLVAVFAVMVGWEAVRRFAVEHPLPPSWTLWIAGANVVIKDALYQYKVWMGQRTGSTAFLANAWDHRSDALCALAVLVGLAIVRIRGPRLSWADEAAALVVVFAILWSAGLLFYKSAGELLDMQADPAVVRSIRESAATIPGVRGVEKLWVRRSGLEFLADIHIEVDRELTVDEGHRISHVVKDQLLHDFPNLRDVLVHLEPYLNARAIGS